MYVHKPLESIPTLLIMEYHCRSFASWICTTNPVAEQLGSQSPAGYEDALFHILFPPAVQSCQCDIRETKV